MDETRLREFGKKYTAAWCSQNPASVAAYFAENGSLQINQGAPSVGRAAITSAAQGFMTTFPDMVVTMDGVSIEGSRAKYRWTLNGTNTGPGGTGKGVRISGHEEWTFGADGLIVESKGHFDEAEYNRQLKAGFGG
jgi:predicted ester cyclase